MHADDLLIDIRIEPTSTFARGPFLSDTFVLDMPFSSISSSDVANVWMTICPQLEMLEGLDYEVGLGHPMIASTFELLLSVVDNHTMIRPPHRMSTLR